MNDTKWNELRLAMDAINPSPRWTVMNLNGYQSEPDREWPHHFRAGGYREILYVDICADDTTHKEAIRAAVTQIGLPGEDTKGGFRIYGYSQTGQALMYL